MILQNHKITKFLRLERISVDHLVQTPAKAGSFKAGYTGMHPVRFCLERGRVHDLSGQPIPVLCQPQHKEILTHFEVKLLAF